MVKATLLIRLNTASLDISLNLSVESASSNILKNSDEEQINLY
jgi:hypothetical protein